MKKNLFIKLLIVILFSLFTIIPVFAQSKNSTISKILINPLQNNTYLLNVYFDNDFNGQLFLEKNDNGFYSVYLTDTELDKKNTKILYKKNADKRKITISLDQNPLSTKGKLSNYVTMDVSMNADYSIRIIPKNINEDKFLFFITPIINSFPTILFIAAIIIFFLIKRIIDISNTRANSYTKLPKSFYTNGLKYNRNFKYNTNKSTKYKKGKPDTRIINTAKKSSFKCFDIPQTDNKTNNIIQYKPEIKQTRLQTNPIEKESLDMPFAEDVIITNTPKHDQYGAEIISSIDIDKNKGVYLANSGNELCLYGRINGKIFFLKKFKDLAQINLQARYYDKTTEGEVYIVRIDAYKAMVEFSRNSIRELVVL